MEYKSVERIVLEGVWMAVSPRRLVSQMFEGTSIGYGPITSDTDEPIEPTEDLEDEYDSALQNALNCAIWQVVERKREILIDQASSKEEARSGALIYAKGIFLNHAEATGAPQSTIQLIKDLATPDMFNPVL